MPKKYRVQTAPRPKSAKIHLAARAFVAKNTPRHVQHARLLAVFLLIFIVAVAGWFGYQFWRAGQLHRAIAVVNSKFEGIQIESEIFNSDTFHGYAAYALTENPALNQRLRSVAQAFFEPCKNEALKIPAVSECQVSFTVDFATADHLQVTYNFDAFRDQSALSSSAQSLLFDRKSGAQLSIENLFKPQTNYLEVLSAASRQRAEALLSGQDKQNQALQTEVARLTGPSQGNFSNFELTGDEKLAVILNSLPGYPGPLVLDIPSSQLYENLNETTLGTFFPKLKEQKEAERRLAEEAKRQAEEAARAAAEAESARRHTRRQVAANRSNINCAAMRCIALTFDDGPGPYTNQVLDALAARDAVATFFVIGNKVASGAATLQRAVGGHNEIANHSWSHPNLTRLSNAEIATQIQLTNQSIFNATGSYPKLMRPPYGATDARVTAKIGMPIGMWSIDPKDWQNLNSDTVYRNVVAGAFSGGVVVLHDIHLSTVQAVPRIIDELQRQGYVLVTMSELFGVGQNNVSSLAGSILTRR